jgi:LemA protein
LKEIIEKLYPEEFGVVSVKPETIPLKRSRMARIWLSVWSRQSRAIKTVIITIILLLVTGCILYYNRFITESFDVHLETAQLEAEIHRKNTLIPGLAKVVEDYMTYEGRVFVHAVDVRNALEPFKEQAAKGTLAMDTQTFTRFKSAISQFQAVSENYPDLKTSEAYLKFMLELTNTERRMADARNSYSIAVNRYNTALSLLPGSIFGYVLGFKPAQSFVADKPK